MPQQLPDLNLTHGQLLWAVRYGMEPDQRFTDQIRYLRLLDIPPAARAQAEGPGKRIRYDFFDLVELGLAVAGLGFRFRPKDIAAVLVDNREAMRGIYADAWRDIPDAAIGADWIKSRGRIRTIMGEDIFIRLHDRSGEKWGEIDMVGPDEVVDSLGALEPIERYPGEPPRPLLPLKHLMLQWVAWALDAPDIRPGRKT